MSETDLMIQLVAQGIGMIPSLLISILTYVLTAMAFSAIAKRRGLKKPWLAWIPVASAWLLGSISDQYRYVVKGETRSKRKVLLGLSIASMVIAILIYILVGVFFVQIFMAMDSYVSENEMIEMIMGPMVGMMGLLLPLLGVSIAFTVIRYIALYDIFKSLDPSNATLFLVLSIIFGAVEPFFLFFNRNKDLGMPQRKPEPQYTYQQPVYFPAQQTWQNPTYPQQPTYQPPTWQPPAYPQNPAPHPPVQEPPAQPQPPVQDPWEPENKDYL